MKRLLTYLLLFLTLSLSGQQIGIIASSGSGVSSLLTGLKGYWKMDATSGTTETNSVGTGDATVSGATVNATGKLSKCVSYTANGQYLNFSTVTGLQYGSVTACSISLWFKINTLPDITLRQFYLIDQLYGTAPYNAVRLTLYEFGGLANQIYFRVDDVGGAQREWYSTNDQYVINTWYHLCVVLPGTGQDAKMYLNNVDIFSANLGGETTGDIPPFDYMFIGSDAAAQTSTIDGYIDEVGIWNRALTSTEVTTLYNSGTGLSYPF